MTKPNFSKTGDFFRAHQQFIILSHVRPDGDAYGSTLALGLSLLAMGKDVQMAHEKGMLPMFRFLPGSEKVIVAPAQAPSPSRKIVAVDTADKERLGGIFTSWNREPDANIDHHISNTQFGGLTCIDPESPATAQVLYELMESQNFPCDAAIASNLFVGISTDTGSFRHRQTSVRTFEIASKLVQLGADATELAQACYSSYPPERLLLLKEVLNTMTWEAEKRIAYFRLTPELLARSGAGPKESKDLVEYFLTIQSVEVTFMVEAIDPEYRRISLRSRGNVDVQRIAAQYGGGGHRLASGIRSKLSAEELENKIVADIKAQLGS